MIDVAIIGAGVMGSLHARNFAHFEDRCRVLHVYDEGMERAASLAAAIGADSVDSLEAVLAEPATTAVAVCVPPRLHREIVGLALRRGKHVFLEKPIATTREDALAISDAARRSERILMVGHVLRFWPGYTDAQRIVRGGELGRPVAIHASRLQAPPSSSGWLTDVSATGGIATLVLVHDFDQLNSYFGAPVSVTAHAVRGSGVSAPHVIAHVEYEGGRGVVDGSMVMPRSHPFVAGIHIYCEHGSVEFGMKVPPRPDDQGSEERDASQFTPVEEPAVTVYCDDREASESVAVGSSDPWRPELSYFLDCVENRREHLEGTAQQAIAALEVALATNESLTQGGLVQIHLPAASRAS